MGLFKKKKGLIKTLPDIKILVTELNLLLHELMSNLEKNFSIEKLNRIAELLQQIVAKLNERQLDIKKETPKLYLLLVNLIIRLESIKGQVDEIPRGDREEAEIYLDAILQELISEIEELSSLITQIETKIRVKKVAVYSLVRTGKYTRDLEKDVYKRNMVLIEKTEKEILNFFSGGGTPTFRGKLAIREKRRRTVNPLHAHLARPIGAHRILYNFDPKTKTIELLRIDTKTRLGLP
tara:strand:- start:3815 stop:4525 length:711 start_codon:yes stop_codon:yes gene_type:complete